MASQTAKSLIKDFRASFRKKKVVDVKPKEPVYKEADEEELAKLTELKENLGNELPPQYNDHQLLGFLRARSLNVKEAEILLKLDENTKKFLRIQEYRVPEDIKPYSVSKVIGIDKEGSFVRLIKIGGVDARGIMNMITTIEFFKILLRMAENDMQKQQEEDKKTGKKNSQSIYVLDLENLSMNQATYKPALDCAVQSLKFLQDFYHDALKYLIFINAPSFFSSVFKLIKPVIKDSLHRKIKICDQSSAKEELLKYIDNDVLPVYLGGNNKIDLKCIRNSNIVPEVCYSENFLDVNDPEVVVVTIPAGATLNFRYPVRQAGTVLRWHIQSKDNDVGVGLYREPFKTGSETPRTQSKKKREEDMSKYEQLTPIIRLQCHICPDEGSSILWFTGNVIIHFDNTYSWMNSKEVMFKLLMIPPSRGSRSSIGSLNNTLNKMMVKN